MATVTWPKSSCTRWDGDHERVAAWRQKRRAPGICPGPPSRSYDYIALHLLSSWLACLRCGSSNPYVGFHLLSDDPLAYSTKFLPAEREGKTTKRSARPFQKPTSRARLPLFTKLPGAPSRKPLSSLTHPYALGLGQSGVSLRISTPEAGALMRPWIDIQRL